METSFEVLGVKTAIDPISTILVDKRHNIRDKSYWILLCSPMTTCSNNDMIDVLV